MTIRRPAAAPETRPASPPAPAPDDATLIAPAHAPAVGTPRHPTPVGLRPAPAALRYQRREALGRGGMGVVWAALDPSLGREVAIKTMLKPGEEHDVRRFVEEAQVTGQLEHPNIVPVHELGQDAGSGPYLVMKRVRGRSLKDVLRDLADGKSGMVRPATGPAPLRGSGADETAGDGGGERTAARPTRPGGGGPESAPFDAQAATIRSPRTSSVPVGEEGVASAGATEPAAGGSAAEAVQKAFPWLLNVFIKVCEAVAYAHSRGVIHRDLKPDNVMVGEFGEVVVMDWGLAKVLGRPETQRNRLLVTERSANPDGVARTMDGEVIGTPMYMPPEQARGKVDSLDERSDVYSLGAILYEILSLVRPFEVDNVYQLLHEVGEGRFQPPSRRSRSPWEVPRELEAVVMKAMARDPEARYPAVAALKEDVEAWLGGRRLSAVEYSPWELLIKFARRHRGVVLTGAGGLLLLILATVLFVINVTRARADAERERDRAEQARARARDAEVEARRLERAAVVRLGEGMLLEADALLLARRWNEAVARYDEARRLFLRIEEPTHAPDYGLVEAYRNNSPAILVIDGFQGATVALAVSPDGMKFVTGGPADGPAVFDVRTGRKERDLGGAGKDVIRAAWSPDGAHVVIAHGDQRLAAWDAATGRLRWHGEPVGGGVNAISFAPDGARFVISTKNRAVSIFETATGRLVRSAMPGRMESPAAAWSPDGKWILTGDMGHAVRWLDAETLEVVHEAYGTRGYVFCAAWSADGRRAITTNERGAVDVWDGRTRRRLQSLTGHGPYVWRGAVSADGRRAVSACSDLTLKLWDLAAGAEVRTLYGHTRSVTDVGLTPDGRRAISTSEDGSVRIWDLATNHDRGEMRGHWVSVSCAEPSPDGRRILSSSLNDGTLRLWDLDGGLPLLTLGVRTTVRGIACLPDGRGALSVGDDGVLRQWDLVERKETAALPGHEGMAMCVDVSPDGRRALTGDQRGWVRLWDLEDRRQVLCMPVHKTWVGGVVFHPDGKRAFSAGSDAKVCMIDLDSAQERVIYAGHGSMTVGISLAPDLRGLATACTDHVARLFETETGRLVRELRGHSGPLGSVCYTPDGRALVTTAGDGAMRRWDVATGRELQTFGGEPAGQHPGAAVFARDGRLITAGTKGVISVRDFSRPARYREFGPRLVEARERLARDAGDLRALATLGEWYAFRGVWDWAAGMLESARAGGSAVEPQLLARVYSHLNRYDDAQRELDRARAEGAPLEPGLELHLDLLSAGLRRAQHDRREHAGLLATAAPVEPGRIEGRLDEGSPRDGDHRFAVARIFGHAGMTLVARLSSRDFRPYLLLVPPTQGSLPSRPVAEGNDAAILEAILPESCEYALLATSADPDKIGAYVLEIEFKFP